MEEAMADGAEQVNNVIHSFRLQSTQFDKKVRLSGRMGLMTVLPHLPQGLHEGGQDQPPRDQP